MSSKQKKFEKYKNNPKSVSFRELKSLLESYGFVLNSNGGSHFVVQHRKYNIFFEEEPRVIPAKKPHVLPVYVEKSIEWIERVIEFEKVN